jgi:hypothetical protein
MPVSRNSTKLLFCPGCRARCWADSARLKRHQRNKCKSIATRDKANGLPVDRTGFNKETVREFTIYLPKNGKRND